MADQRIYPINYQGYEVVYSHTAECPKDYVAQGMKYCPVFDDLTSYTAAMQKLNKIRRDLKESTYLNKFFEYCAYVLKINDHTFELHYKAYILPQK